MQKARKHETTLSPTGAAPLGQVERLVMLSSF